MKTGPLDEWEVLRLREIKYRDTRDYPAYPIPIGNFKQGPATLDDLKSDVRFLLGLIDKLQKEVRGKSL